MVRLRRREFERLVREALESLPPFIKAHMDNVDVVVKEWPTRDDLEWAGLEDRHELLALYQGVPLTERYDYTLAARSISPRSRAARDPESAS